MPTLSLTTMSETMSRTSRLELGDLVGVREIEREREIIEFEEVKWRNQTKGISEAHFVSRFLK